MHKVIRRGSLFWNELIDILLKVETQVNRHPLNYVEDDPDLPILTPATFLFQRTTHLPEEQTWHIPDKDLRRRARFLQTCKDHMWTRWQREYLTALRERHNLFHKTANHKVKVGDAVMQCKQTTRTAASGPWLSFNKSSRGVTAIHVRCS